MLASILIIAFSLALLAYWFRYSCILLMRNQQELAEASCASADNRFNVGEVQAGLQTGEPLDALYASLQRDYQVLSYLLDHAAGLELEAFEDRLLVLDYRVMHLWYCLIKTAFPVQARAAVTEMAAVLGILIGKIDQRAAVRTEA